MLSHSSTLQRLEASKKNNSNGEVSIDRPWSRRFSIVLKMAAAINVPLSQELYSEVSLKKKRLLCLRIMVGRLREGSTSLSFLTYRMGE